MNYSKKVFYISIYVNTGYNYKAKDFIKNQIALIKSHPDYDYQYIPLFPEDSNYIDNLFLMYRKQFPKSDRNIQSEITRLANIKIKKINVKRSQLTLF